MSNEKERLNGYALTRAWFDFAFENQDILCPTHTAMFLWFIELNNRMGWVGKFASPASQTMAAIGLKSYNTYKKIFNDLVEIGVVKVVEESKNQYTACIIALSNFDKAQYKALDKALTEHSTKHLRGTVQSTRQSIDSIIKPINKETNKPINNKKEINKENFGKPEFKKILLENGANEIHIDDWLKVREKKKAANTQTALTSFLNECQNNNFPVSEAVKICAEKSWQGFKYEWTKTINNGNNQKLKPTCIGQPSKNVTSYGKL